MSGGIAGLFSSLTSSTSGLINRLPKAADSALGVVDLWKYLPVLVVVAAGGGLLLLMYSFASGTQDLGDMAKIMGEASKLASNIRP